MVSSDRYGIKSTLLYRVDAYANNYGPENIFPSVKLGFVEVQADNFPYYGATPSFTLEFTSHLLGKDSDIYQPALLHPKQHPVNLNLAREQVFVRWAIHNIEFATGWGDNWDERMNLCAKLLAKVKQVSAKFNLTYKHGETQNSSHKVDQLSLWLDALDKLKVNRLYFNRSRHQYTTEFQAE